MKKTISILAKVLIPILILSFPSIWNTCVRKTHNVNDFLTEKYVKYNGGTEAKHFFNEYVNLEEYKDIAFHYCDGDRLITIDTRCKTMFILDVWYEDDIFFETVNKILKDTKTPTLDHNNYECDGFYVGYFVTKADDLYVENSAEFMIDVKHNTIRYCFIYDASYHYDVAGSINSTFVIPWNYTPNDWAFDYSEIIDTEASSEISVELTQ